MADAANGEWFLVLTAPGKPPYLVVPSSEVQEVCSRLDRAGLSYSIEPCAVSIAGEPEDTTIRFSPEVDGAWVQAVLNGRL
jgi:hypothetical protein